MVVGMYMNVHYTCTGSRYGIRVRDVSLLCVHRTHHVPCVDIWMKRSWHLSVFRSITQRRHDTGRRINFNKSSFSLINTVLFGTNLSNISRIENPLWPAHVIRIKFHRFIKPGSPIYIDHFLQITARQSGNGTRRNRGGGNRSGEDYHYHWPKAM